MTLKKLSIYLLATVLMVLLSALTGHSVLAQNDKLMIGWVEKVRIYPESLLVDAKIDTGADHSSLNVSEVNEFKRDGKPWVRFTIRTDQGSQLSLEKPVFRYAKIKRKGAKPQRRPVVLMDICLGTIYKIDVPVNLADRRNFKFNMLIGRSFLENTAVVDSSQAYSIEPNCPLK